MCKFVKFDSKGFFIRASSKKFLYPSFKKICFLLTFWAFKKIFHNQEACYHE